MTVRRAQLPAFLLVEVIWSFAAAAVLVAVLGSGGGPAPSILGVAACVIGSFTLARALQQTHLEEAPFRAVGAGASVLALAGILYAEYGGGAAPWDLGWGRVATHGVDAHVIAAAVVLTALWMRGVIRGQQSVDSDTVMRSAALGFLPVAIAAGMAPDAHGPDLFGLLAILYLLASLCALALYQAPNPDRSVRSLAAQWGAAPAATLGLAAVLTVVAAAVDPGALGVLAPIGKPIGNAVGTVLLFTLGSPLAVIGWLLSLVPWPHAQQNQMAQPTPAPIVRPEDQQHDAPAWARVLGWIIAGGAATLLMAGALVVLWYLFRRYTRRKDDGAEHRERVEAELSLGSEFGAAFDALARRFRRTPRAPASTVEIQRLYHEMLAQSSVEGVARPASATPLQFAPRLDAHYASPLPSDISRAFAEWRYGAHDPDTRTVTALRDRWRAR